MMASLDALNEARLAARAAEQDRAVKGFGTPATDPNVAQRAVRKLGAGQPLTPEEQAALGISTPAVPSDINVPADTSSSDSANAAAAKAAADKAAADKAAADKAAADAEAAKAAARTAAERAAAEAAAAAAKAAQDAAARAAAIAAAKAASDKAANDLLAADKLATAKAGRVSAYNILYSEFDKYGLGSLVSDIKNYLIDNTFDPSEFSIQLKNTPAYQDRFAANEERIKAGLSALKPSEYIALEDQYQSIMRNYGMPETYWSKSPTGKQAGFEKFIAGDVSASELEDRIMTAQNRVLKSNPEVLASLKAFYPDITNGDILAYTLNPKQGLDDIKRRVTAAEIGGAAVQSGLNLGQKPEEIAKYAARAAELQAAGVTKAQAQEGFQTVAEVAPRGGVLSEIYKQSPYTQTTAESEIFNLAGSAEAAKQRKKLTSLETAAFGGRAGAGAISRDRAGVL